MKKTLAQWTVTLTLSIFTLHGGHLVIDDPTCAPSKVKIHIADEEGKTLHEYRIDAPKNGLALPIRFDGFRCYHVGVTTDRANVKCYFKGTRGDRFLNDPDLICDCLYGRDRNATASLRPGAWRIDYHWRIATNPRAPVAIPDSSERRCLSKPLDFFGVDYLSQINAQDCPIVSRHQGPHTGSWIRKGSVCRTIKGSVRYDEDHAQAEIFYRGVSGSVPDATLFITGSYLGPCD